MKSKHMAVHCQIWKPFLFGKTIQNGLPIRIKTNIHKFNLTGRYAMKVTEIYS